MTRNCDIDSSREDLQIQIASVLPRRNSLQHYLEAYMDEEDAQDEFASDEPPDTRIDNLALSVPPPVDSLDAQASACSTSSSPLRPLIISPSPTNVAVIASSGSETGVHSDVTFPASPSTPSGSSRRPKTPGIQWPLALYVRPPFSPKSPSPRPSPPTKQPTSTVMRSMLKRSCVPYDASNPDGLACDLDDAIYNETTRFMTPPPTPAASSQRYTLRPPEKLKRPRTDVEETEQRPRTKRRTKSWKAMPPPPVPERSRLPSPLMRNRDLDMDREDTPEPESLFQPLMIAPTPIKNLSVRRPIPVFHDE